VAAINIVPTTANNDIRLAVDLFASLNQTGIWAVDAHFLDTASNDVFVITKIFAVVQQGGELFTYELTITPEIVEINHEVKANATTDNPTITNVTIVWTNPLNIVAASDVVQMPFDNATFRSVIDLFSPDSIGEWRVDAHFNNATHQDVAIISKSFNVTTDGDGEENHAPVAADDFVTTLVNVPIIIDVLANDSDPDGDLFFISAFTQASNGSVTQNPNSTLTYTPEENFKGFDSFTYKISDGDLESSFANVTISVTPGEELPTADAGPDQVVDEETIVSLSGSASEGVTIAWSQISGEPVDLIGADTLTPTFLAPSISHSDPALSIQLTFELVVTDDNGASASDTVVITVNDVNKLPVADAGPDQVVDEGDLVELAGSGSDPDGDALTFSWEQTDGPPVELSDANSPTPSFTAPKVKKDTDLTFELEVSDGFGGNSKDSVNITVVPDDDRDDQGCSPGFWKQHVTEAVWGPTGFSANHTVGSIFQGMHFSLADNTLVEALNYEGGPGVLGAEKILLRSAVAALLNSAHPDINYPRTTDEVIAQVNNALESGDRDTMLDIKDELDADNNLGCSIDAHGNVG
jgi:hypothetical protein